MILVYLLAGYILLGLLTACAFFIFSLSDRAGHVEVEDIIGSGFLWPVFWAAAIYGTYRWLKDLGEGWFQRQLSLSL